MTTDEERLEEHIARLLRRIVIKHCLASGVCLDVQKKVIKNFLEDSKTLIVHVRGRE